MQKVFTTIGSESILNTIIRENPDRQLYLYYSNNGYQIVDPYSSTSIFKIPLSYQAIFSTKIVNWKLDKNTTHLKLDDDSKKLFLNTLKETMINPPEKMKGLLLLSDIDNPNQLSITSFWQNLLDCKKWYQHNFISDYQKKATTNYYSIYFKFIK